MYQTLMRLCAPQGTAPLAFLPCSQREMANTSGQMAACMRAGGRQACFLLHLRLLRCAALPSPLPLTLRTPQGAMARDMCRLKCCCCCCCWQTGRVGDAAVSCATMLLCCQLAVRPRLDLLLPAPAAAALALPRRRFSAASARHFCSWQVPGTAAVQAGPGRAVPCSSAAECYAAQVARPSTAGLYTKASFLRQAASQCLACTPAFLQQVHQQAAAKLTLLLCPLCRKAPSMAWACIGGPQAPPFGGSG